jgi:hypothetical protein
MKHILGTEKGTVLAGAIDPYRDTGLNQSSYSGKRQRCVNSIIALVIYLRK